MTSSLIDSVKTAFEQAGWTFSPASGRPDVIECQFDAHHTRVALHVQTYEEFGAVSVVASPGIELKTDRLAKGSELLMRCNLELNIGNLEVNWETGKVFFRATNVFPDPANLGAVPQSLVHSAIAECDRLTPMVALINRDLSPAASFVDVPELLTREDLLPPVPEGSGDKG